MTVGAIENYFTCVGFNFSGVFELFNEINTDEILLNIFENENKINENEINIKLLNGNKNEIGFDFSNNNNGYYRYPKIWNTFCAAAKFLFIIIGNSRCSIFAIYLESFCLLLLAFSEISVIPLLTVVIVAVVQQLTTTTRIMSRVLPAFVRNIFVGQSEIYFEKALHLLSIKHSKQLNKATATTTAATATDIIIIIVITITLMIIIIIH